MLLKVCNCGDAFKDYQASLKRVSPGGLLQLYCCTEVRSTGHYEGLWRRFSMLNYPIYYYLLIIKFE